MYLFRMMLVFYALLLTLLLLHPSPFSLFGGSAAARLAPPVGQHFLAFSVLGFLVALSRPPGPTFRWIGMLLAYAAGTELLQGLVPARTPSLFDFFENVAGIACGTTVYLVLSRMWSGRRSKLRSQRRLPEAAAEPVEPYVSVSSRR